MKTLSRFVLMGLISSVLTILALTACGGGSNPGSGGGAGSPARAFIFNANPVGLRITGGFGTSRADAMNSPFVVNAATPGPGGGNFSGFCNGVALSGADHRATVIYGIGRWSSGSCEDAADPDSDVGVTIPQTGQIGNLTVDAVGQGHGSDSGQMEVKIIHSDGTQTITPLTCSLGTSGVEAKVHCEDKTGGHQTNVNTGDQLSARFFYNAGDAYRAIRVNIEYATPTF